MGKFKEFIRKKRLEEDAVMHEDGEGGGACDGGGIVAPSSGEGGGEIVPDTPETDNHGLTQPEIVGTFDPKKGVLCPNNYIIPRIMYGYPVWRWKKSKIRRKKKKVNEAGDGKIQGFEDWRTEDIISDIEGWVNEVIENYDLPVEIIDVAIHGSRGRHTARPDSDLDVVISYKGEMKEDSLWNILNADDDIEPLTINGISVDFNPINVDKTGSMEEYLKRSKEYDDEVLKSLETKKNQ
jgi:predicted nucleotidyltransferase